MQTLIKFALFMTAIAALPLPSRCQTVEPAPIPETVTAEQRRELGAAREALAGRARRLASRIEAFNEKYATVAADSPLARDAEQEAAALEQEKKDLTEAILRFNSTVLNGGKTRAEGAGQRDPAEIEAALMERWRPEAQRRWLRAAQVPEFEQERQGVHDLYVKGDTREAELKAGAMLERARAVAVSDARIDVQRWKELQAMLAKGHEAVLRDPEMRKAWESSEAFLRSVEAEVDARMKSALIAPDDSDLDLLFGPGPSVRVWPGPKNPDAPLPNPLRDDVKREKVRQMIIWERRETERVDALFERPDIKEAVCQALEDELRQEGSH